MVTFADSHLGSARSSDVGFGGNGCARTYPLSQLCQSASDSFGLSWVLNFPAHLTGFFNLLYFQRGANVQDQFIRNSVPGLVLKKQSFQVLKISIHLTISLRTMICVSTLSTCLVRGPRLILLKFHLQKQANSAKGGLTEPDPVRPIAWLSQYLTFNSRAAFIYYR